MRDKATLPIPEVYDFSHVISEDLTVFPKPWHKPIRFETLGTMLEVGRRTAHVSIGTHAGTHIDAPSHFLEDGISIDKLPIRHFFGKGTIFRIKNFDISSELPLSLFKSVLKNFQIGNGLFFNFGWGANFKNSRKYYRNQPWISPETAKFICNFEPKIVGYDMAMLDNPAVGQGCAFDSPIHKIFLGAGIPLLENAKFLDSTFGDFNFSATPLSFKNLDGSPVRFVGWR